MSKHKVPYLAMRNGRPRWVPGPKLRAAGAKGQDLKDEAGNWLAEGPAIEAAKTLNLASPLAGEAGAPRAKRGPGATGEGSRTMQAAIDRFLKCSLFTSLKKNTQRAYRYHLVLIGEWSGDLPAASITRGAMRDFYDALREERGHATANAVMRTLKRLMNYVTDELEWTARNKAAKFEMSEPAGRLVIWSLEEIVTFVAAADYLELASQGDGALLGAMSGQREADVMTLRETAYDGRLIVLEQRKTGVLVRIPAIAQLRARIAAMRARKLKRWPGAEKTTMLICESTGKPYHPEGSYFRTLFRHVRDFAGGLTDSAGRQLSIDTAPPTDNLTFTPMFSILGKRWQDLRDTAVTWLAAAGCTVPEIATITGHTLATVTDILDRHYFVRDDPLGDAASAKLEAYLTRSGL